MSTLQAVVKACESLTEGKKIREKVYGKQKVYVADQVRKKNLCLSHSCFDTINFIKVIQRTSDEKVLLVLQFS